MAELVTFLFSISSLICDCYCSLTKNIAHSFSTFAILSVNSLFMIHVLQLFKVFLLECQDYFKV
uniref:Uncharacterized protein n=1 Tax=Arundo donax TaxID=35708 RepID=A0A0A9FZZ1_ARUDO